MTIPLRTAARHWSRNHRTLTYFVLIVLVSLTFRQFPELDIWVSSLFNDPAHPRKFPALEMPLLLAIRESLIHALKIIVPVLLLALIARLVFRKMSNRLPLSKLLYAVSALLAGPAIVTNLILKENWGRARPRQLEQFGGSLDFSLPWTISDQCSGNCSFVSGETSGAIWLITLLPLLPLVWQRRGLWVVLAFTAIISALRIVFGAHFTSDVLLSLLLNLFVFSVLRGFFFQPESRLGEKWLPRRWTSETLMASRTGFLAAQMNAMEQKLRGKNKDRERP